MKYSSITREAVCALVNQFYGKVREDDLLGPVFFLALGEDWDLHLAKMAEFWCTAVLGTHTFQGNVYGTHMALLDIEPDHFERWLGLFGETVHQLFNEDDAMPFMGTARRVASSLQVGFFGDVLVTPA